MCLQGDTQTGLSGNKIVEYSVAFGIDNVMEDVL